MESKKKLKAAIVAAGIVVALVVGAAIGVVYQKSQPVNLQVTSYTDGGDRVYDVQTYPATESVIHIYSGNNTGFSTTSRVIQENDTSSYVIELKN